MTREEVTLRLNRKDGSLGETGKTSSRPMRRARGEGSAGWRLWRLAAPSGLAHQGASSGEVHGAGAEGAAVREACASRLWAEGASGSTLCCCQSVLPWPEGERAWPARIPEPTHAPSGTLTPLSTSTVTVWYWPLACPPRQGLGFPNLSPQCPAQSQRQRQEMLLDEDMLEKLVRYRARRPPALGPGPPPTIPGLSLPHSC